MANKFLLNIKLLLFLSCLESFTDSNICNIKNICMYKKKKRRGCKQKI